MTFPPRIVFAINRPIPLLNLSVSPEYEAVPKGKSIDMLFDYVEKYKEVQGAMVDSLEHLTEITRDEKVRVLPSVVIYYLPSIFL